MKTTMSHVHKLINGGSLGVGDWGVMWRFRVQALEGGYIVSMERTWKRLLYSLVLSRKNGKQDGNCYSVRVFR